MRLAVPLRRWTFAVIHFYQQASDLSTDHLNSNHGQLDIMLKIPDFP